MGKKIIVDLFSAGYLSVKIETSVLKIINSSLNPQYSLFLLGDMARSRKRS